MVRLRFVPDKTNIKFMRARFAGLIVSAVLSTLSVLMYFYPGMNFGIDFAGGIVIEVRTQQAADLAKMRATVHSLVQGEVALQEFGGANDVLLRIKRQEGDDIEQNKAVDRVKAGLNQTFQGIEFRRVEVVGPKVSGELVEAGFMAVGLALLAVMLYIWFRFEREFGIGAVVTLVLDITKTVGLYALTQMEFSLTSIAAVLMIIGYSINDKVVVYDRMRENLRKYKSMDLRSLIDLSINETLARTIYTSTTTFLSILPLAFLGSDAVKVFAVTMLFGIVVGTSSSIFIAAPIVLLLGEQRLRRGTPSAGSGAQEKPAPAKAGTDKAAARATP
jgi:preprotein translocase subunit SecF